MHMMWRLAGKLPADAVLDKAHEQQVQLRSGRREQQSGRGSSQQQAQQPVCRPFHKILMWQQLPRQASRRIIVSGGHSTSATTTRRSATIRAAASGTTMQAAEWLWRVKTSLSSATCTAVDRLAAFICSITCAPGGVCNARGCWRAAAAVVLFLQLILLSAEVQHSVVCSTHMQSLLN